VSASQPVNREKGVALVMVLSLLALVGAWAASSLREDEFAISRAENAKLVARAWMAVESGHALAIRVLREDAKAGDVDSLDEVWAQPVPDYPVDEGVISGSILDANRYVNLNDLVGKDGRRQDDAVALVRRLFDQVGVLPDLVDALVDWMDADHIPAGSGGAEDAAYADRDYRVKNAPLDRMEELLLIVGFDTDVLARLRPVVAVWPSSGKSPININTASKDVLLGLADHASLADVEAILARRREKPFAKVTELTSDPVFAGWISGVDVSRLAVSSRTFFVRSIARFGRVRWAEEALLSRSGEHVDMLYRQRLAWPVM